MITTILIIFIIITYTNAETMNDVCVKVKKETRGMQKVNYNHFIVYFLRVAYLLV